MPSLNFLTWEFPPATFNELLLWRCFCVSCEADVWQVISRWVKRHGSPFDEVLNQEDYEAAERNTLYRDAIMYTFLHK